MDSAAHRLQQDLLGGMDSRAGRKRAPTRKVSEPRRSGFAKALALVVEGGRKQAKELGTTSLSRCPRCGHEGPTQQDFGTRTLRGERRPQSWCRACRAHALPPLRTPEASAARQSRAASPPPPAQPSAQAEGWLFPPETLRAPSPRRRKRSAARPH